MNQETWRVKYPLLKGRKILKKYLKKIIPFFFLSAIFGVVLTIGIGVVFAITKGYQLLVPGMAIWIFLAVSLIHITYLHFYIKTYFYDGDNDFITIKKGVFAPVEIHVNYQKVQDVYVDQDIFDRVLGLYDVHISSATITSGMEAHIDGVSKQSAEQLKNIILNRIKSGGNNNSPKEESKPQQVVNGPASFSSEINISKYPIMSSWMVMQTVFAIISSFVVSGIAAFFVFANEDGANTVMTPILLIFIGVFFVLFIVQIIYSLIWQKNFRFDFAKEYIVVFTSVLANSETHVPYHTIQDVTVSQGIVERMFGLARVVIENASGNKTGTTNIVIPGQTLNSANAIAGELRKVLPSYRNDRTGL